MILAMRKITKEVNEGYDLYHMFEICISYTLGAELFLGFIDFLCRTNIYEERKIML